MIKDVFYVHSFFSLSHKTVHMESIFCKIIILHIIVFIFPVIMSQNPDSRSIPPGSAARTFRRGSTPLFFAVHTFDYAIICLFYLQLLQHPLLYYPFSFILATILCSYAYKTDSHPITPKHVL